MTFSDNNYELRNQIFDNYINGKIKYSKDYRKLSGFRNLYEFIIFLLKHLLKCFNKSKPEKIHIRSNQAWFFINSKNTEEALGHVESAFLQSTKVYYGFKPKVPDDNLVYINPLIFEDRSFKAIVYLTRLILDKRYTISFYRKILRQYSLYDNFLTLLKSDYPTYVAFANDHIPASRSLLFACRELGIQTLYVQHAHVNTDFPTLSFNYAFLNGRAAYDTYKQIGIESSCVVRLIGSFKRCNLSQANDGDVIGLAINPLDEDKEKLEILKTLKVTLKTKVIVRFHQHFGKSRKQQYLGYCDADFSSESLCLFFDSIDILVAGQSSILLDAAINKILSISYYSNNYDGLNDLYGFENKRVVSRCKSIQEVLELIKKRSVHMDEQNTAAAYYDEGFKHNLTKRDQINIIQQTLGLA